MIVAVRAAAALLLGHLLPGVLLVRTLRLGRSSLERWVMAAVFGGPISAAFYLVSLVAHQPSLYWILLAVADLLAVSCLARRSTSVSENLGQRIEPHRRPLLAMALVIVMFEAAYLATTGSLCRVDDHGDFLMDPAFAEDILFHVGMVRSLESSFPPELLSFAGVRAAYHVGYDLQVAAWSRFFSLDPFDGLHRVGPLWSLALLVLSVYLLGLRFAEDPRVAPLSAILIFGSGFGFLFASAPRADWWSLVFMDASLVSIFLINPLLPALSLLLVGFLCLDDYLRAGTRRALLGSVLAVASLFELKLFLAVQVVGAAGLAALVARAAGGARIRRAATFLVLLAAPLLVWMTLASGSSNTSIGIRPLEIVRYSLMTLGREGWADRLAAMGQGKADVGSVMFAGAVTLLWLVGFLGVRLLALRAVARDLLSRKGTLRLALSIFVLVGFPLTLLFRIAPAEATGLSREEALNDALWFATNSGFLLWFWTAESLVALWSAGGKARRLLVVASVLLTFPAAVQHFVHKASLSADVIPQGLMDAARVSRELSRPGEVFVEPVKRVRPSVTAYLAGRPVVYEAFVGYNYMFVPHREVELRRHALSHFWRSTDPGYTLWFLTRFHASWIFVPQDGDLPAGAAKWTERAFTNEAATLYRVRDNLPEDVPVALPTQLPLAGAGAPFFGEGWERTEHRPRRRCLVPGRAALYLPLDEGVEVTLELRVDVPHSPGRLALGNAGVLLDGNQSTAALVLPARDVRRGLNRLEIFWEADEPLLVTAMSVRRSGEARFESLEHSKNSSWQIATK